MNKLTQPQRKLLDKMLELNTGFYFQFDSEKKNPKSSLKMFNTFLHNRELRIANRLLDMGLLKVEEMENRYIYFINK